MCGTGLNRNMIARDEGQGKSRSGVGESGREASR